MKFSVVVPTYNEEKHLGGLLESLKDLRGKFEFEVIVSDSNSKDNTRKIARKYGVRVINGPKAGPAKGRNLGARAARGEFIIFMNADETVNEGLFQKLTEQIDEDYAVYLVRVEPQPPTFTNKLMFFWYNTINGWFVAHLPRLALYPGEFIGVKKTVFDRVGGFDEDLQLSEDRSFALKCMKSGKPKFINDAYVTISTRRMDAWGWPKFFLFHTYSYIYYTLFKKPINYGYDEVR